MRMVLYVGRGGHVGTEFHDIGWPADLIKRSFTAKLLDDGHNVDRLFLQIQRLYRSVDFLMTGFVESLRLDDFRHDRKGVLVNHEGTQDNLLYIRRLRLQMSEGRVDRSLAGPTTAFAVTISFRHLAAKLQKIFHS